MKRLPDCLRFESFNSSGEPTAADRIFAAEHLRDCPDCRAESDAWASIQARTEHLTADDAGFVDDLRRRRFINDVLVAAAADPVAVRHGTAWLRRPGAMRPIVAASVAVVVLSITVAILLRHFHSDVVVAKEHVGVSQSFGQTFQAVVLMSDASDLQRHAIGDVLPLQEEVFSGASHLVFDVGEEISIVLAPDSQMRFTELNDSGIALVLLRGTLSATVAPKRTGPPLRVKTADASLRITGTVFSVTYDGEGTTLSVMRGSVEVVDTAGRDAVIQRSERIHLPSGKIDIVTAEETDRMEDVLALADLTERDNAGQFRIRSEPVGAIVSVNGHKLGATPLNVMLKSADVLLTLELPDYASVSERLILSQGDVQERMFMLSPLEENREETEAGSAIVTEASSVAEESAAVLLSRAQQDRMKRNFHQASRTYERLIRLYPDSGEAAVSMVSVGKLYLSRLNNPRVALARFDQYVRRGGPLLQEAVWGRAQALRALGRTAEERSALQFFLSRWPGAMESDAARLRLEEMR